MKTEIIEALTLELTKGTMAQKHIDDPTNKDLINADIWVKTYLESEKQIKEAINKANPPVVGAVDLKGW